MTEQGKRPEMGKLIVGQCVMVRLSANDSCGRKPEDRYIPAVVIKVGRVWVDLDKEKLATRHDPICQWRMRMDTQNEGSQYFRSNASFATLEQHHWDLYHRDSLSALKDHGIDLAYTSRWRGREIELAEIINAAVAEREDEG